MHITKWKKSIWKGYMLHDFHNIAILAKSQILDVS